MKRVVRCIQVFRAKHNSDESIEWQKAKIVVKGIQTCGVDNKNAFTVVAKMNPIDVLLCVTTIQCWALQKMNTECFSTQFKNFICLFPQATFKKYIV